MNALKYKGNTGNTLLVALVFMIILGTALVSYYSLLSSTNRATVRSESWNSLIPVSEAGVEEALTHLNTSGRTNLLSQGWQSIGGPGVTTTYYMQRALAGGTYFVTISNYVANVQTNQPVIEARAYALTGISGLFESTPMFAAVGLGLNSSNSLPSGYVRRGVPVLTHQRNAIARGLISKGSLQMQNVSGIAVDSYDSSNPLYSTDGRYDSNKFKPNGFIGTNSRINGDMQVQGNLKILGTIGTGANNVLNLQSPASAGDLAHVNNGANAGSVQAGHLDTSLNIPFPDVAVPYTAGHVLPTAGNLSGTNYTYLLNVADRKYRDLNITLDSSSKKILVTENCSLYVVDSLKLNNGSIIIAPGKTLKLYVEKAFEAKGATKINANGVPSQLLYYGRPQNTSFQVMDSAQLVGVFYAPQANAQFQGTSSLAGGGTFGTVQLQHSFKFHYDEALGGDPNGLIYFVNGWTEMAPAQVATLPAGVQVNLP